MAIQESNPVLSQAQEQVGKVEAPAVNAKLAAVEEALQVQIAGTQQLHESQQAGDRQVQSAARVIEDSMATITAASQTVALATDTANLQAQNNANSLLAASGGVEEQVRLMTNLREDGKRVEDLLNKRSDIMDDRHFGLGRLDTAINTFRAEGLTQQIKSARLEEAQSSHQIATSAQAQESFARINNLNKQSINDATIAANQRKIGAVGNQAAAEQRIKNAYTNADSLAKSANLDALNSKNLLSVYRLEGEEKDRILREEQQAFAREKMAVDREALQLRLPTMQAQLAASEEALKVAQATNPTRVPALIAQNEKIVADIANAEAAESQQIAAIREGQSISGIAIEPEETVRAKMNETNNRTKYTKLQELGGTVRASLGNSAYEATVNLRTVDPDGLAVDTNATIVLDQIANAQALKYQGGEVKPPKDVATAAADFNTTAEQLMTVYAADIKSGDQSNPYQLPPMAVLETKRAVIETALYQKVLKRMQLAEVEPQFLMNEVVSAVLAKTLTPEEAAEGIDTLYTSGAVHNNTFAGGFDRAGLSKYNQVSYNTTLKVPPTAYEQLKGPISRAAKLLSPTSQLFSLESTTRGIKEEQVALLKTTSVDLMDTVAVKNHIVRLLSTQTPLSTNVADTEGE